MSTSLVSSPAFVKVVAGRMCGTGACVVFVEQARQEQPVTTGRTGL